MNHRFFASAVSAAALAAVLAGCGAPPAPVAFAGETYHACQEQIALVQGFEAQGRARAPITARDQLTAYGNYLLAYDKVYLDPACKAQPGAMPKLGIIQDFEKAGQFLDAATATVTPDFAKYGPPGEDIFTNAKLYGTDGATLSKLAQNGTLDKMVAMRNTHAAAKAALEKAGQ